MGKVHSSALSIIILHSQILHCCSFPKHLFFDLFCIIYMFFFSTWWFTNDEQLPAGSFFVMGIRSTFSANAALIIFITMQLIAFHIMRAEERLNSEICSNTVLLSQLIWTIECPSYLTSHYLEIFPYRILAKLPKITGTFLKESLTTVKSHIGNAKIKKS